MQRTRQNEIEDRITEVWLDSHHVSYGSGYLLGGGLILTALHVVHPEPSTSPTSIKARPLKCFQISQKWQDADLIWPSTERVCDQPDVALLKLRNLPDNDNYLPLLGPPKRRISGSGIWVSAIGFPSFAKKGTHHDTEEILGYVKLGSRIKDSYYEISEVTGYEQNKIDQGLDWHGMSGAALLFEDSIIGVIIARKSDKQRYDFRALRIEHALRFQGFKNAIVNHVRLINQNCGGQSPEPISTTQFKETTSHHSQLPDKEDTRSQASNSTVYDHPPHTDLVTILEHLRSSNSPHLCEVRAPYGSGKSFFMRQLFKAMDADASFKPIKLSQEEILNVDLFRRAVGLEFDLDNKNYSFNSISQSHLRRMHLLIDTDASFVPNGVYHDNITAICKHTILVIATSATIQEKGTLEIFRHALTPPSDKLRRKILIDHLSKQGYPDTKINEFKTTINILLFLSGNDINYAFSCAAQMIKRNMKLSTDDSMQYITTKSEDWLLSKSGLNLFSLDAFDTAESQLLEIICQLPIGLSITESLARQICKHLDETLGENDHKFDDAFKSLITQDILIYRDSENSNFIRLPPRLHKQLKQNVLQSSSNNLRLSSILFAFLSKEYKQHADYDTNLLIDNTEYLLIEFSLLEKVFNLEEIPWAFKLLIEEIGAPRQAIKILERFLAGTKDKNPRTLICAMHWKGIFQRWLGHYDEAISTLESALELANDFRKPPQAEAILVSLTSATRRIALTQKKEPRFPTLRTAEKYLEQAQTSLLARTAPKEREFFDRILDGKDLTEMQQKKKLGQNALNRSVIVIALAKAALMNVWPRQTLALAIVRNLYFLLPFENKRTEFYVNLQYAHYLLPGNGDVSQGSEQFKIAFSCLHSSKSIAKLLQSPSLHYDVSLQLIRLHFRNNALRAAVDEIQEILEHFDKRLGWIRQRSLIDYGIAVCNEQNDKSAKKMKTRLYSLSRKMVHVPAKHFTNRSSPMKFLNSHLNKEFFIPERMFA